MLVNFMCLAVKLPTATGMSAVGTCSHYNTNLIIDSIGCAVIFLQLAVFITQWTIELHTRAPVAKVFQSSDILKSEKPESVQSFT